MATVYSLICWGGKDGKSVTVSSTTDYVTLTNHGLRDGTGVAFTGGTLPSVAGAALALNTTYYAKSISSSTYELYYDAGLTSKINFTSNGSSLVMKSAYYLGLTDTSRWGARIYDGAKSWRDARAAVVQATDEEVCEIGMAWDDLQTSTIILGLAAGRTRFASYVNGVRSGAFHNGNSTQGYRLCLASAYANAQTSLNTIIDGIGVYCLSTDHVALTVEATAEVRNVIAVASSAAATSRNLGFTMQNPGYGRLENCIAVGFQVGIDCKDYAANFYVLNCTVTKCVTGFRKAPYSNTAGTFYNNVSIGNTTNWEASPTGIVDANKNAGGSSEAWVTSGRSRVDISGASPFSATFVDWDSGDFRPVSGSVLIDAGTDYYGILGADIAGSERPNYNNGGAEAHDIGAYEFDNGYGPHPSSQPVAVSGMIDGSRLKIAQQSDGAELYNAVLSGATSISYTETLGVNTPVYLYVRKGSAAPFYKPLRVDAVIDVVQGLSQSLAGLQIADIARAASYPSGVATDWSFNASTGAITHDTGSTIYTVQALYSYYRDHTDDSATVDDTLLMDGITPTVFSLINSGTITDAHLQYLKGGSIEYQDGTLWSNVYSVGTLAGTPDIYLYQNGSKLTAFWPAGHLDVLIKVANAGTLIDAGLVTGYIRKWGYTYDNYEADLSGGGRNVMPLATATDPAITESTATVAGWTDITVSFGSYSLDFADGDGAQTYYARIDCNGRPLAEVYQRMQYLTREGATATLNGVAGERYAAAHASLSPIKAAPFGIYSGGIWSLAPGVWLDDVGSGDLYNFVLTDASGGTHQNVVALFQSVTIAGLTIGSRVQIYDTTNDLELFNDIATATSVSWEDTVAPAGDRAIRLRVAYVDGADARNFIEASIGTCGTASGNKDVSFLVSQTPDAVYNANAIDGSAVAGVTFTDATINVMNIDIDAGEVNLGQLYAAWVWYAFSETGITTDIDYIHAIDQANYICTNLRWKNTTSPAVPLKITGGYAWDVDTEDPIDLVDTTGGTIFLAPPHVVAKTITVSGSSVITGDIADLPTAAEVAVAVLAAAESDPIHADAKRMNGAAIAGTGAEGDLWRGV